MKNKIYILFGVLTLAFISCDNHSESELSNLNSETFTYSLSVDPFMADTEFTPLSSRAVGDPAVVGRYIMQVWNETGETPINCFDDFTTNRSENTTGNFKVNLDKSKKHTILFWADNDVAGAIYNTDDLRTVSIKETKAVIDAFYHMSRESPTTTASRVTLKRAVGEVAMDETGEYTTVDITVSYNRYTTFNVMIGNVVETETKAYTSDVLAPLDNPLLGSFFLFAPSGTLNFTFNDGVVDKEITNVKVEKNTRTNLKGHFFDI